MTSSSPSAGGMATCGRSGTSACPDESCANAAATASIAWSIGAACRSSAREMISMGTS
jgi:hypothetical protein